MKQELARIKSDVETIQRAMGMPPSFRGDWVQWMKRDNWLNLWWCLPGVIIIASSLLPIDRAQSFFGLLPDQWTGLLVAAALLGIAIVQSRRATREDGRPESLIRETKRVHGLTREGFWFGVTCVLQLIAFFVWSKQHQVGFETFWTGLFLLCGSTFLVTASAAKARILLGYAIPFMAYGLCLPLAANSPTLKGVLFGTMFVAVAVCFSLIQVLEIRKIQHANSSH